MNARFWWSGVVLSCLAMAGCESSGGKGDAGVVVEDDSGTSVDGGPGDAGPGDAGTDPLACEKQHGVCAGARRAMVDGAYEPECTALSYGADYESSETRCDGLDNDCDGVTDPSIESRITALPGGYALGQISSLRTEAGVLVAVFDGAESARVLRLDDDLKVQETSSVPMAWVRTGTARQYVRSSKLLRTSEGLALFYSTANFLVRPLKAYLVPLDENGAPKRGPDGEVVEHQLLDRPLDEGRTVVAASTTEDRVVVLWTTGGPLTPPIQVMGTVVDSKGQVLVAPKALFESTSGWTPAPESALWLRNGELLVALTEESGSGQGTVRVRRLDAALAQVGEERAFTTSEWPAPQLVDLGEAAGAPLASPVLVWRSREAPESLRWIRVAGHLFDGGQPVTWLEDTPGDIPWFGAFVDEGELRLSWLSRFYAPGENNTPLYWGRLWTQDPGVAPVERTPGLELMSLNEHAMWVLMEKVAPRRMATMYTATTAEGQVLDAVRYCTP
ncbi:putative metal-binding motif-containing protein [Myxococcus sp. K38C18041901]|uniref:putative metal-binding motif-containing protein n=1 Tax=Myxococcus guangdongensis TaxID=2906760 RepID=UPI0020A748E1|nr:putative metal-binding motif-containing protein [Myxococcus guangdongensis]MCP3062688.1 putative metal-binding motif-containing protein [Myxococcus guangdongensis]